MEQYWNCFGKSKELDTKYSWTIISPHQNFSVDVHHRKINAFSTARDSRKEMPPKEKFTWSVQRETELVK
jgi:hypothetical protein